MKIVDSKLKSYREIFRKPLGFTLIEVMIVVAIVGILATIAYPSYVDHVTRSNRAEALRELTHIANLQEQFFVDTRNYTGDLSQLGLGSGTTFTTESQNYVIAVSNFDVNTATFTLRATAKGVQASNDSACLTIDITDTGNKVPVACWEQ